MVEKTFEEAIPLFLRNMRETASLTHEALAKEMGCSVRYIEKLETEQEDREIGILFHYANACGFMLKLQLMGDTLTFDFLPAHSPPPGEIIAFPEKN